MVTSESVRWFADLASPLFSKFGDGLTLCREGKRVEWSYDGRSAVVELTPQGTLEALFIERPTIDAVTSQEAAAVYRSQQLPYALTPAGCTRMVDDMVDFFSGVREPRFVFATAYTLPTAG